MGSECTVRPIRKHCCPTQNLSPVGIASVSQAVAQSIVRLGLTLAQHMVLSGPGRDLDGLAALSNLWVSLLLLRSEVWGHSTGRCGEDKSRVLGLDDWSHSVGVSAIESAVSAIQTKVGVGLS